MNRRNMLVFVSLLVMMSMLLAACGGGAEPTPAAPAVDTAATDAANAASADATKVAMDAAAVADAASADATKVAMDAAAAVDTASADATKVAMDAADAAAAEETKVAEEAAAAAAPAEEPTEVPFVSTCTGDSPSLLIWADDTRSPVLIGMKDQVLADTGVCLDVQEVGFGDIRTKIGLAGPAGEGPDIFVGAHDWLGELYANGVVAPMDLGAKASDFDPVSIDAFSYEGQLYGLPNAVENVAFLCNKDLVPTVPATYDELKTMSKELQDSGEVTQFFVLQKGDPYHNESVNTAFGGYIFGVTDTGYDACDVGLDSEGAVAYLTWLDGMVKDGLISPDVDGTAAEALFESGDAACIITGPWNVDRFTKANIDFSITVPPAEIQSGSPFVGVQGFMINSFSPNKVLAQSFLVDYVATTDVMEAIYEAGKRPPAYLPARAAMDDVAMAFSEVAADGHPMPAIPAMGSVWSAWGDAMTTVVLGTATPEEAAASAAQEVREAAGCQ